MSEAVLPSGPGTRASGWWGMALLVATEATLFGTIFGTYLYLRSQAPSWPPAGIAAPKPLFPLVLAGVLVSTSPILHWALVSARGGRARRARLGILLAVALQAGYLTASLVLYAHDLARFSPQGSAYGSIYFTMLGAHHAHVAAGLLLELWLLLRLARGLTRYRLVALQATTFYWDFVNVLALAVVAFELSAGL